MHRRSFLVGTTLAVAAALAGRAQDAFEVEGVWGGLLPVAGGLRLRLEVGRAEDGGLTATLYSIDQGDAAIVGERVRFEDGTLSARFPSIRASLALTADGADAMAGTFTQGAAIDLRVARDPDFDALTAAPVEALTAQGLAALREQGGAPGLAAAARGPDGRSVSLADGLRSKDEDFPLTPGDRWHIGSISKSFTATLAATLVEEGVVGWDTPLGDVLGGVVDDVGAYGAATLLHLLSHRSGLPGNIATPRLLQFPRFEDDARDSRIAYLNIAFGAEPEGPMGETYEYSNSGYVAAGVMIETLTGQTWEAALNARVVEPLGLSGVGHGPPNAEGEVDAPLGHGPGPFGLGMRAYRLDNPAVLGPAGRLHMPLSSLLDYLDAHRTRAGLLRPESWDTLHTPPFGGDYALGWIVRDGALWHNGSNTVFYAEAQFDREAGVVAAAAANMAGRASTTVAQALAGAVAAVSA